MGRKQMRYAQLLLLSFLLVLPVLSADIEIVTYPVSTDFSAFSSSSELSLCQCETRTDIITITNTGSYASKYTLASSLPDLTRFSQSNPELLPGQSVQVYAYISAPCDRTLSRTLTYTITDIFANVKTIDKTLTTGTCQNLEASLIVDKPSVTPCEPVTYSMFITNTGVYTETYDAQFGSRSQEDAFSSPYQSIIIPPGQSGVLNASFQLACHLYGDYVIPFSVVSRQSKLRADFEHELIIEPDYDYSFEVQAEDLCAQDESRYEVIISNEGGFQNNYTLSISNASFASLDTSFISIPAGSQDSVFITLSPSLEELGPFTLVISVTDSLGSVSQVVSLNNSVKKCYHLELNIQREENIRQCAAYLEIPVIVQNLGSVREEVFLNASGHYAYSEDYMITLDPFESQEVYLIIDVPSNVSVKSDIFFEAHSQRATTSDTIFAEFFSEFDCTQVLTQQDFVWLKLGDEQQKGHLTLEHTGLQAGWYDIYYDGPSWLELDNHSQRLYFEGGQERKIYFYVYQDNRTVEFKDQYEFTVTLISEDGLEYHIVASTKFYRDNIFIRAYDYFKPRPCLFASLILGLFIIIAIIVSVALPKTHKRLPWLAVLLALLWLVIVAVHLGIWGLPDSIHAELPAPSEDLEFVIAQRTSLSLNASKFFVDPDGDILRFNASSTDNVSVSVIGDIVTLTPDKEFFGQRRFRLYASDEEFDVASPRMSLVVIERAVPSISDYYRHYCMYINLTLLLFAFALLYLIVIQLVGRYSKQSQEKPTIKDAHLKKKPVKKKSSKKKK